jgi:hypothetical protein
MTLLLSLGACANQTVRVYESTGEKQCEGGGVTLSESKVRLTNAGIDVLDSKCGIRTGVGVLAVCGGTTVNIHTHKIKTHDLEKAKGMGFANLSTLVNKASGTGYEFKQCPSA